MIESSLNSAEEVATKMGQASDAIEEATQKTINRTERTTLTVNKRAQSANETSKDLTKEFQLVFQQTIDNIQHTAEEFERTDNEQRDQFNIEMPHPYIKDTGDAVTYGRAKNG